MDHADGRATAADRLAEAVRAATPSALLPSSLAHVDTATATDDHLLLTLTIDGRAYAYRWPEHGTLAATLATAPSGHPPAAWTSTVLANLAETLEAADRGLAWALERGVIRAR